MHLCSNDATKYLALFPYPLELRTFADNGRIISGYYDDIPRLIKAIETLEAGEANIQGRQVAPPPAIYTTLNEFAPNLIGRSHNRLQWAGKDDGTKDKDIVRRHWLPIDCDPVRPSGISSTDDEHNAALGVAKDIREYLTGSGFPLGLAGDSGNGAHILYRIDLPADNETRDLVKHFLQALARRFSTPAVSIDEKVFNAARIWKCYGTMVRKGDEVLGQRHRRACILELPATLRGVEAGLIRKVIEENPAPRVETVGRVGSNGKGTTPAVAGVVPSNNGEALSRSIEYVENFLQRYTIEVMGEAEDYEGGRKWRLTACPLCGEADHSTVVMVMPDGRRCFHCAHNRCKGLGWREFRAHYEPETSLPVVIVNKGQLRERVNRAIESIQEANNPPQYFQRGGVMCRMQQIDEKPSLCTITDGGLMDLLSNVATWKKVSKGVDGESILTDANIPKDLREVILSRRNEWLPVIGSIVETPTYSADGELLLTAGYDGKSKVWYAPDQGLVIPTVSPNPNDEEIERAKHLLLTEVLGDFPFNSLGSKANLLALFLQPFVRRMTRGATPLYAIKAPAEGTGKGLLVDCFALISTGRPAELSRECSSEEEYEKTLLSALMTGKPSIVLDNIGKPLKSSVLASYLTGETITGRVLGGNDMITLPNTSTWIATGNNIKGSKEIIRRMVLVALNADMENPSLRSSFRHSDLKLWVKAHRGDLVWACLTLIGAWIAKGKPLGKEVMGSYPNWAGVMGGILQCVGIEGFLSNREELYEEVNTTEGEWREFIFGWYRQYDNAPMKAHTLLCYAEDAGLLTQSLAGYGSPVVRLGNLLSRNEHKVWDNGEGLSYRLTRDKVKHQAQLWRLGAFPTPSY